MMGGMKRPPAGSEGSGRGPYVTALFYALGSVLVLFGELFSAEAESAYGSQADKDIADGLETAPVEGLPSAGLLSPGWVGVMMVMEEDLV